MDTTAVLAGMLEAGLTQAAAFAIHDPQAVRELIAAGIGSEVTMPIGGRYDLPSIGQTGRPLTVTGRVKLIADGLYVNAGPMGRGERMNMGHAAVLDTGGIEIALILRHVEPFDVNCLRALGIEPTAKRFLMLKSRIHWARRPAPPCQGDRRVRRGGRLHLGLRDAGFPQGAPADLSARSDLNQSALAPEGLDHRRPA
jgi:microcystin degradation protein MlrC